MHRQDGKKLYDYFLRFLHVCESNDMLDMFFWEKKDIISVCFSCKGLYKKYFTEVSYNGSYSFEVNLASQIMS